MINVPAHAELLEAARRVPKFLRSKGKFMLGNRITWAAKFRPAKFGGNYRRSEHRGQYEQVARFNSISRRGEISRNVRQHPCGPLSVVCNKSLAARFVKLSGEGLQRGRIFSALTDRVWPSGAFLPAMA